MTVWCLGSINRDTVLRVPHLPLPGETLAASDAFSGLGGKGANQSVAAARAGARVHHLGRVGADGDLVLAELAGYGVETAGVVRDDGLTGAALITVDDAAENCIVILAAANRRQDASAIAAALAGAAPGDTLLLQNETSAQVEAAQAARAAGLRVVYSAAPFAADAVRAVLPCIDVLLLNEGEAAALTEALGTEIGALSVRHVVVTLGARGARHHDIAAGTALAYPSLKVTPVDTTGAGDTFAGYLAAGLDAGRDWPDAMRRALAAAALATTRPGAAAAIPSSAEVDAALA